MRQLIPLITFACCPYLASLPLSFLANSLILAWCIANLPCADSASQVYSRNSAENFGSAVNCAAGSSSFEALLCGRHLGLLVLLPYPPHSVQRATLYETTLHQHMWPRKASKWVTPTWDMLLEAEDGDVARTTWQQIANRVEHANSIVEQAGSQSSKSSMLYYV